MKTLALIILLVISGQNAFAGVCERAIDARMSEEFSMKSWAYQGTNDVEERKVWRILENSVELNDDGREAIRMHLDDPDVEFYISAGIGSYSSTFEELIMVSRSNCRIMNRAIVYVE